MTAPLFDAGVFGETGALVAALLIGIGFGWFLERGGMGSARKLSAQFYLTDMTVFKVMFSAIVTAALGLFWLSRIGWLDLHALAVPPTYLLPQAVGGTIFGLGFVMGGLCPGTSCVAAASGAGDGLAVMAGMLAGILGFAELLPLIQPFYDSTPRGALTLDAALGLGHGATVALLTFVALAGFAAAEAIERRTRARLDAGAAPLHRP